MDSCRVCLIWIVWIGRKNRPDFWNLTICYFLGFVPSMSFRRLAAIATIFPKRGLEEFVSQTSVAGKDVVYGGVLRGIG